MKTSPQGEPARADIQALRGLAVLLVVIYHAAPGLAPGGYVGVDVFFAISGYLITGSLLSDRDREGHLRLLRFYQKRILRLLPASLLVLSVVAVAHVLLPATEWTRLGRHLRASALFFQNLELISESQDYLRQEGSSPLQHYWSLAVEEQFYFCFPFLLSGLLFLQQRIPIKVAFQKQVVVLVLGLLALVSLVACILLTATEPVAAYFSPLSRAWQLLFGACLCLFERRGLSSLAGKQAGGVPSALPGAVGIGLILVSALTLSRESAFPGALALAPVLGTVLLLARPLVVPSGRLAQVMDVFCRLGDVSYSLYLWHFPVLVLVRNLASGAPGDADGSVALDALSVLLSLVLATLTKRFVEDPFVKLYREGAARSRQRAAAGFLLSTLLVGGLSPVWLSQRTSEFARTHGKLALVLRGRADVPEIYAHDCYRNFSQETAVPCLLGPQNKKRTIVLFGDSHAAQWVPALEPWAEREGVSLVVHVKYGCPPGRTSVLGEGGAPYPACDRWREDALEQISRASPEAVIVSQSRAYRVVGPESRAAALPRGLRETAARIQRSGAVPVFLLDTPRPKRDMAACVLHEGPERCAFGLPQGLLPVDPLLQAADGRAFVLDMNPWICPGERCEAVVEGRLVYRDAHHLTAGFAQTLLPPLGQKISSLLAFAAQTEAVPRRDPSGP